MSARSVSWMIAAVTAGCGESEPGEAPSWEIEEERELRELLASIKPSTAKLPQLNPLDTSHPDCEPYAPSYPSMCEWMLGLDDLVIAEVVEITANESYYDIESKEILSADQSCPSANKKIKLKIKTLSTLSKKLDTEFIYIGDQYHWTNRPRYSEDGRIERWHPDPENYLIKEGFTMIFPVYRSKTYDRWTTSSELLFNVTRVNNTLMVHPQGHLPASCVQLNIPIEPINLRTGVPLQDFISAYQRCAASHTDINLTHTPRMSAPRMKAEEPIATHSGCRLP